MEWPPARRASDWLRLGRCRVCGTSVLVDDEFVRLPGSVRHSECDRYLRARRAGAAIAERPGRVAILVRGGPGAAADAREQLAMQVEWLPPSTRATADLLLTELVTNAVRHGGADQGERIEVTLESSANALKVAVTDPGPGFEWHPRPPDRPAAEGGYGLVLVDRFARLWAVERGPASTTVWFELGPD
jgi:anti-sigma regulatory factor (Ser/Thr protein kinase)